MNPSNNPLKLTIPIFWGSLLSLILSIILGGVSYLEDESSSINKWVLILFCLLLSVRYYFAIVFHAYKSKVNQILNKTQKISVFTTQVATIIGCSLTIAILPFYGINGSFIVILAQSSIMIFGYWIMIGIALYENDKNIQHLISFFGDCIAFFGSIFFISSDLGNGENELAFGMVIGMVLVVFLIEITSKYAPSIKLLIFPSSNLPRL